MRTGTFIYGLTVVHVSNHGSVTTLPDGRQLRAAPEDNVAYRATAVRCAYGQDTMAMCQDHDRMHARLAEALGLPVSPALLAKANDVPIDELTGAEEDMVLAAQRFMNLLALRGIKS